jgi:hypothetical protein
MNTDKPNLRKSVLIGVNLWLILLSTGCSALRSVSERITGEPAKKATLFQSPRPDDRREAILFFADHDYGREEKYTRLYQQIARQDTDPLVRAVAIRALNRSRDKTATPVFIAGLTDAAPIVRLESAKALNRVPDDAAVEPLLKVVNSETENRDIRLAAAEALQHYRTLNVARQLVPLLNQKDFSIAWQARKSLQAMTGQDMAYNQGAWLKYITGPEKPLG